MFKAELQDVKKLKGWIDIITPYAEEGRIKATAKGLSTKTMDDSRAMLLYFDLTIDSFNEYLLDEDLNIDVEYEWLNGILKRVDTNKPLEIELNDPGAGLILRSGARTFTLPLITLKNDEDAKPPEIEMGCEVKMDATLFGDIIKDVESLGGVAVGIKADVNYITFDGGAGQGKLDAVIQSGDTDGYSLKNGVVESCYGIELLRGVIKASELSSSLSLGFGDNVPIRLDYDSGIGFLLAPRVDKEER